MRKKKNLIHIYNMKGPFLTFLVHTYIAHRQPSVLEQPRSVILEGICTFRKVLDLAGVEGVRHEESVGLSV